MTQDEGLQRYSAYLKVLVGLRAREDYQGLSMALDGPNSQDTDFVGPLTTLFKDVALAVEDNEQVALGYLHFLLFCR